MSSFLVRWQLQSQLRLVHHLPYLAHPSQVRLSRHMLSRALKAAPSLRVRKQRYRHRATRQDAQLRKTQKRGASAAPALPSRWKTALRWARLLSPRQLSARGGAGVGARCRCCHHRDSRSRAGQEQGWEQGRG